MFGETLFGMELSFLLPLVGAVSAAGTIIVIWTSLLERDRFGDRLIALQNRRSSLKAEQLAPKKRQKFQPPGFLQRIIHFFDLARRNRIKAAHAKLAQAGFRSQRSAHIFLAARVFVPALGLFASVALVTTYGLLDALDAKAILIIALLSGICLIAPDIFVKNLIQKRQNIITKSLPDGFDLLVICADAGLSLDAALDRVAREMKNGSPELADELALTSIELSFLPERSIALHGLSERVPLPGIRALVNTFVQTERFGTPLAQALKVMSNELRNERMMKAEEKAARLPAILTVPMIIFILPPLFVVLLGPAIIRSIDALAGI